MHLVSFGNPADSESPVALRPPVARGLPFRERFWSKYKVPKITLFCQREILTGKGVFRA